MQILVNKYGRKIGIALKPDLNSLKNQKFTHKTRCDTSHYLRKLYIPQNYYSPNSKIKINRYRQEKNLSLSEKAEIKTHKNRRKKLNKDNQNKVKGKEFNFEKNIINENNKNEEKELNEENKIMMEDKEKELNEEKNRIIENYKIKEIYLNNKILEFKQKEKIIEDKEKKLNEEKNKIIEDYKNLEKELIIRNEMIENYKIKEKELNEKKLILEKKKYLKIKKNN